MLLLVFWKRLEVCFSLLTTEGFCYVEAGHLLHKINLTIETDVLYNVPSARVKLFFRAADEIGSYLILA